MNSLTPKTPETIYYTAVSAKLLKSYFFKMAYGGHFGFLPTTTYAHTFESGPLQFHSLTFKEDKNTKKRTFALHGHGSALVDPTIVWPWLHTFLPLLSLT